MARRIHSGLLLVSLLIGPVVAAAAPASLDVILTIDPRVSAATRTALIEEATRIWDRAGVRLEVILPSAPTPSTVPTLRIMAIPWPALPALAGGTTLGELIRTESSAVVMLSLDEAERIVTRLPPLPGVSADRRLGLILGRAAAHEIGHYLLDASAHARHGLMRARFDEREFGDPRSHAFELDRKVRPPDPVILLSSGQR